MLHPMHHTVSDGIDRTELGLDRKPIKQKSDGRQAIAGVDSATVLHSPRGGVDVQSRAAEADAIDFADQPPPQR